MIWTSLLPRLSGLFFWDILPIKKVTNSLTLIIILCLSVGMLSFMNKLFHIILILITYNLLLYLSFTDWLSANSTSPFLNPITISKDVSSSVNGSEIHVSYQHQDNINITPAPDHNTISDIIGYSGGNNSPGDINSASNIDNSGSSTTENLDNTDVLVIQQPVRHSHRSLVRPKWWTNYHISGPNGGHAGHSKLHLVSSDSSIHKPLTIEPSHYYQAIQNPKWIEAMQKDLQALEDNNTWCLVPLSPGKRTVGCKWIYKIKYHSNGEVDKYKERLVAK